MAHYECVLFLSYFSVSLHDPTELLIDRKVLVYDRSGIVKLGKWKKEDAFG